MDYKATLPSGTKVVVSLPGPSDQGSMQLVSMDRKSTIALQPNTKTNQLIWTGAEKIGAMVDRVEVLVEADQRTLNRRVNVRIRPSAEARFAARAAEKKGGALIWQLDTQFEATAVRDLPIIPMLASATVAAIGMAFVLKALDR